MSLSIFTLQIHYWLFFPYFTEISNWWCFPLFSLLRGFIFTGDYFFDLFSWLHDLSWMYGAFLGCTHKNQLLLKFPLFHDLNGWEAFFFFFETGCNSFLNRSFLFFYFISIIYVKLIFLIRLPVCISEN